MRKNSGQFPRTSQLPSQSSKYWAKEKDRLLRQLLISDIENVTNRELAVYYARIDQPIMPSDSDDLSEVLEGITGRHIDLLIHTPGGGVDAVEKIVTVLKKRTDSFRVLVPGWAKSGGTVIAISSSEIVLGINSEMGPIDPQLRINGLGMVPAEVVANDPTMQPAVQAMAKMAVERMRKMAANYLAQGMLKGKTEEQIAAVVAQLSSATSYGSHGAVIDSDEAKQLGLTATYLEPSDELWKRIWLLHCCYEHDAALRNIGKFFEGALHSLQWPAVKI
jgi:ClpP class serine protease